MIFASLYFSTLYFYLKIAINVLIHNIITIYAKCKGELEMQRTKINFTTLFLGIIALMLSIIVIYTTVGLVVANSITTGEIICEPVPPENDDITFIIED